MNQSVNNMLLCGLVFVVMMIVIIFVQQQRKYQLQLLIRQAKKRNGIVKGGFFSYYPQLNFSQEATEISIHIKPGGESSRPQTILEAIFPSESNRRIHIFPKSIVYQAWKVLGLQDIQLNDPNFDQVFALQTNVSDFAHNLFSPEIRNKLLSCKSFQIDILLEKKRMKFIAYRNFLDDESYDLFIETGLLILRRLKELG